MLATLLLIFLVQYPLGAVPLALAIPMADMATCEAWLADPTPLLVKSAFPVALERIECVDEPIDPGKPV